MPRFCLRALLAACTPLCAQTVDVSRMWHNHQPLGSPETATATANQHTFTLPRPADSPYFLRVTTN